MFNAERASWFANCEISCMFSFDIWMDSFFIALFKIWIRFCSVNLFRTKTLERERSAEMTSKDGFSVVAPISVIIPDSTYGRRKSCWALLNLWISSRKRIVFLLNNFALFTAFWMSALPALTADIEMNWAWMCFEIIFARVVLPEPGGPQKIIEEDRLFCSIAIFRGLSFPTRCSCPTNSFRFCGRMR